MRLWSWEFCRRVGFANPITGAGFNFISIETWTQYYPEFLEWRWNHKVSACHGTVMTVLGEHGFPGALIWLGLLGSCLVGLWRLRQSANRMGPEAVWAVAVADMLLAAFTAYMVGGTFVDLNYFDLFYQLVAMVVMLKALAPKAAASVAAAGATVVGARPRVS
jgi:O-antigen ligase